MEKRKELREKLSISIDINADTEISEYERLREKNIRELEDLCQITPTESDMILKVNWVPYISKNLDEILSSDMVLSAQSSIQNYAR